MRDAKVSPQILIDPQIQSVFNIYGGLIELVDSGSVLPEPLLLELERIGCARRHVEFLNKIRDQGCSFTGWKKRIHRNHAELGQLLLKNREGINHILATYNQDPVRILISPDASDPAETDETGADIKVNFEERDEFDIDAVLTIGKKDVHTSFLSKRATSRPLKVGAEGHAMCVELAIKLEALLGCSVTIHGRRRDSE